MNDLGFELNSFDIEVPVKLSNGKIQVFNVREELSFSKATLTEDFMEQAGKYAWWSVLAETAKAHKEQKESAVDKAEAEADKLVREMLELDGIKITESLVKSRIKLDEGYLDAIAEFNKAKKNASILDKIAKAFEQRKDMLMVTGTHLRSNLENSGDLRSMQGKAKEITNRDY